MAVVTFTVATKTFTAAISAANATRFGAWAAAQPQYNTMPNPSYNPALPVDPVTNPVTIPNPEPAIAALAAVFQGLKANVLSWEKSQSVAAVPTPADLT